MSKRYHKLRPPAATPADEICHCAGEEPVQLQTHLSYNPVTCVVCNLEVGPERLRLPEQIQEKIASWRAAYESIYLLWLDSREYEAWALDQLVPSQSPANRRALELVSEMNSYRRTYFWWFLGPGVPEDRVPTGCPSCGSQLSGRCGRLVCDPCSVIVEF